MDQRTQFHTLLLLLRKNAGSLPPVAMISTGDWEAIFELSLRHGVAPLLLFRLKEKNLQFSIPREMLDKLTSVAVRTGLRNTKLYHELGNVLSGLRNTSIPAIVLKGAHLAELVYPNISLRPMDDVDLLVMRRDLKSVEKKLFEMDYVHLNSDASRVKTISPHHLTPFRKDGGSPIEVHWILPSMGSAEEDIELIWARSEEATVAGSQARVLSPEDLLLHVSIHASLHHRFGLGLRPLADVAAIVDRHAELDWAKVRRYAAEWRSVTGVYLTLHLSKNMLGANIPDDVLKAMRPEDFDPILIEWAKEQIFTRNAELGDSSAISPRLAEFLGSGSFYGKLRELVRLAFPSRETIAGADGIPLRSWRLILFYPRHWRDILLTRGAIVGRFFLRDRETLKRAAIYRKLLDKS